MANILEAGAAAVGGGFVAGLISWIGASIKMGQHLTAVKTEIKNINQVQREAKMLHESCRQATLDHYDSRDLHVDTDYKRDVIERLMRIEQHIMNRKL